MDTTTYILLSPLALIAVALFAVELVWQVKKPKNARYLKTKKIKRPATTIPWRF